MADYSDAYPTRSDTNEEVYAAQENFYTTGFGVSYTTRERRVYCNFCQGSVRPEVFAMRQHRHLCFIDPRRASDG